MILSQILFPGVKIIDQEREMIATVVRDHFAVPPADQMEILIDAQPKPGAGKAERRPWNRLQAQHVAIKRRAFLDIRHVQRNVVKLEELHCRLRTADFNWTKAAGSIVPAFFSPRGTP